MVKYSGIYVIECVSTDKIYVGSSVNCRIRLKDHVRLLKYNTHGNRYLQSAWNKYSHKKFRFWLVEECEENLLKDREQAWILSTKSAESKHGFNCAYPVVQRTPSKRMSKAHKTYWAALTDEEKAERVRHMASPEFQARATEGKKRNSVAISKSVKEIWQRPESLAKKEVLRARFEGFKTNKKVLAKISSKAKERWKNPEYRARGLKQLAEACAKAAEIKRAKSLKETSYAR